MSWRTVYLARITSDEWYELKRELIEERGDDCEECGRRLPLEMHHLTYERLGYEDPDDLKLLCKECHEDADEERRHDAALQTYALKKHASIVCVSSGPTTE
jgi:hypothetical protein